MTGGQIVRCAGRSPVVACVAKGRFVASRWADRWRLRLMSGASVGQRIQRYEPCGAAASGRLSSMRQHKMVSLRLACVSGKTGQEGVLHAQVGVFRGRLIAGAFRT